MLDYIQYKAADIFVGPHISVTKNKRSKFQLVRMKRSMNYTNEEEREEYTKDAFVRSFLNLL